MILEKGKGFAKQPGCKAEKSEGPAPGFLEFKGAAAALGAPDRLLGTSRVYPEKLDLGRSYFLAS